MRIQLCRKQSFVGLEDETERRAFLKGKTRVCECVCVRMYVSMHVCVYVCTPELAANLHLGVPSLRRGYAEVRIDPHPKPHSRLRR